MTPLRLVIAALIGLGAASSAGVRAPTAVDVLAAPPAVLWPAPVAPAALAAELEAGAADVPVFDVRSAEAFAEFRLPGAVRVAPEELAARLAALPAGARPVVVDRDGTAAWAAAGYAAAVLGANARPVRVLEGGAARWWLEIAGRRGAAGRPSTTPATRPTPRRPAGC